MFEAFTAERREELDALARGLGAPRVSVAELAGRPFNPVHPEYWTRAEVCFAVRRPNGALLTAIKPIYPPRAYRLPTGGIEPGERVRDALAREAREETGLETELVRFLAAIAYRRGGERVFETFAFLLDERGGELAGHDPAEPQEFREARPEQLETMARTLESLPDRDDPYLRGSWRDWGRFRAVVHREARAALA